MLIDLLKILLGLGALYYGGEFLVTACIRIAKSLNLSPFAIGATVIGFGTSAPELTVSILASLQGAPELAMGNVIGSNVANVGLVLGLTAIIIPLTIRPSLFKTEAPPLIAATLLILWLAWDYQISRLEGVVMVLLLALFLWFALRKNNDDEISFEEETSLFAGRNLAWQWLLALFGLGCLLAGAQMLVDGAVNIARSLGVSEWMIGISIVAAGTSMPEIASSIIAAKKGHGEMAIGNIFGSNIFNILMVLGLTATIHPLKISEPIQPDLLYCAGTTFLLLALLYRGMDLKKLDGAILLGAYTFYLGAKSGGIL
ncbi:MAG: calcium/sodium antiporter [Candidatus Nitrohelix vancouverensis]|uniref:Calcium/sodium antiporter n=1 Tax=Candidatus Nitrohelix vancouverensis TaxID=2705534 RepID=A0A7T0G483_9BACT|nr:MAG: calcium/sodium antiporter [Candidatus Nitrohelix vancouverensis]